MLKFVKEQEAKKFLWVILTMVCASLLQQTPVRAQLPNPTLPAGVDENSGVKAAQGYVTAIEIDSSDPANTKVIYSLSKGTISAATFTAPGIPNGISGNSIESGNFYFPFNESNVQFGSNAITLTYRMSGSSTVHTLPLSVVLKGERAYGYTALSAIAVLYEHGLYEYYDLFTYPKVYTPNTSKRIYALKSDAYLKAASAQTRPSAWDEAHDYRNSGGISYFRPMVTSNWGKTNPLYMYQACTTNQFLRNNPLVSGEGIASITFNSPAWIVRGKTVTVPLIPN